MKIKFEMWSLLTLLGIIGLSLFTKYLTHHISVTVVSEDQALKDLSLFSGERVYKRLKILNDIGVKVTGSYNNEVKAVEFLKNEFNLIQENSNENQTLLLEHQILSGSTNSFNSRPTEYRNLQNIVMTLLGQNEENSILVNCHFDSGPDSFGASDDGANCAIMLEILRVLSQKPERQKLTLVFLFNGAEEVGLLGSQAFMENYKVTNISAFVNLESTGSGGKEILFQASPKNYLLLEHYRKSVKRPFGQAMADEVFKSGLVPAGTDYEIFDKFFDVSSEGILQIEIPGLDFAQFKDGYRYHTKYDHVRFLKPEEMQHTGENILGLVTSLANADELPYPAPSESAVYFDFLGLFMVVYTESVGTVINIIVSLLAFLVPYIWHIYGDGVQHALIVFWKSFSTALILMITLLFSFGACFLLSLILMSSGKSMTWYTNTFLAPGIYSSLTLIITVFIFHMFLLVSESCFKTPEKDLIAKYHLNGMNLFWSFVTIFATISGTPSAYVSMVISFISLTINILIILAEVFFKYWKKFYEPKGQSKFSYNAKKHSWIVIHFIGHFLTVMWSSYWYFLMLELFIPIAGKKGTVSFDNDLIIGVISLLFAIITCMYYLPLMEFLKTKLCLYVTLVFVFIVSIIIAMTGLGFPFRGDENYPTPQRHEVINMQRILQDVNGNVTLQDSGYTFALYDVHSTNTIKDLIKPNRFLNSIDDKFCKQVPFCGYFGENYFLNDSISKVRESKLELTSKDSNFTFSLIGKHETSLLIKGGTSNLTSVEKYWDHNVVETVRIVYGKEDLTPIIFEIEPNEDSNEIQITVITEDYTFDDNPPSPAFKKFIQKMPPWTTTIMGTCVSRTYRFSV